MIDTKELRTMVDDAQFGSLANFVIGTLLDHIEAAEAAEAAWKVSDKSLYDMTEKVIPNLRDQLEAAEVERDTYKVAYEEWIEKSEWVQHGINDGTIPLKYLGWHRVDVVADLLSVAEKEAAHVKEVVFPRKVRAVAVGWETKCARLEEERDALRARIEAMERQEPVATVRINAINGNPSVDFVPGHRYLHHNDKLYLAPGAQPSPSFADAHEGAMEEVAIWKKRALEAEDLSRKFVAEINGPTYMGELTQPALSVPTGWKLVPIDPTRNMLDRMDLGSNMLYRYRAMLAAAPEAKP